MTAIAHHPQPENPGGPLGPEDVDGDSDGPYPDPDEYADPDQGDTPPQSTDDG